MDGALMSAIVIGAAVWFGGFIVRALPPLILSA